MAGEYQLAQQVLQTGLAESGENDGMDEETFARAMMYELIEHNKKTRSNKDMISELEQLIRNVQDEGNPVITRGC